MSRKPALPAVKPKKPPLPVARYLPPWETGTPGPVVLHDNHEPGETQIQDFSHLKVETMAIRRLFVAEYIKDFNGAAAVRRLGLNYQNPNLVAGRWLSEPYTQHLLDRYINECEADALTTRNRVIAALVREANYYGLDSSGASRVSALGKLAKILGMEINKTEVDVRVAGGVMLIPMAESPEE